MTEDIPYFGGVIEEVVSRRADLIFARGVMFTRGKSWEVSAAPVGSMGSCARCDAYLGETSSDYLHRQSNVVKMEKPAVG